MPEALKPLPGAEDCVVCHEAGPPLARRDTDTPSRFDAAGLRAWRIFGFVARSLGLLMVLLILCAAIFGYR